MTHPQMLQWMTLPPLKFYNATDNCILSHIDTYIIEYSIRKVNVGGDELICCLYKTFGWDFHLLLHLRECNLLKEELTSYFSSSLLLKTLLLRHLRRGLHHLQSSIPRTSSYAITKRSSFTPVETHKTVVLQAGEITIEWNLVITLRTNIFKHMKDPHNEGSSKKGFR